MRLSRASAKRRRSLRSLSSIASRSSSADKVADSLLIPSRSRIILLSDSPSSARFADSTCSDRASPRDSLLRIRTPAIAPMAAGTKSVQLVIWVSSAVEYAPTRKPPISSKKPTIFINSRLLRRQYVLNRVTDTDKCLTDDQTCCNRYADVFAP